MGRHRTLLRRQPTIKRHHPRHLPARRSTTRNDHRRRPRLRPMAKRPRMLITRQPHPLNHPLPRVGSLSVALSAGRPFALSMQARDRDQHRVCADFPPDCRPEGTFASLSFSAITRNSRRLNRSRGMHGSCPHEPSVCRTGHRTVHLLPSHLHR